jgi:antirestriction protein ArdC
MSTSKPPRDLYQEITDAVILALKGDRIPWEKPWHAPGTAPRSVSTGKLYQGGNALWLGLRQDAAGYASPWWLTFKQAKKLKGTVRKGEKSSPCVYWTFLDEKKDGVKTGKQIPLLRSYAVFNLDQCDVPAEVIDRLDKRLRRVAGDPVVQGEAASIEQVAAADHVIGEYLEREGIGLTLGGDRACYRPATDEIRMPLPETFKLPEHYTHTLLHECIHSTGHADRLNRPGVTGKAGFGSEEYGREELVAELGASFAAGHLRVNRPEIDKQRDSYIQHWIKALEDDKRAVLWAAARASKASDRVLDIEQVVEAEEALEYKKN